MFNVQDGLVAFRNAPRRPTWVGVLRARLMTEMDLSPDVPQRRDLELRMHRDFGMSRVAVWRILGMTEEEIEVALHSPSAFVVLEEDA